MAWYNNNWKFRKKIVLNKSLITKSYNDFTFLFKTKDGEIVSNSRKDGKDIIFVDKNNNLLNFDIIKFDRKTSTIIANVNININTSDEEIYFYIYYGNQNLEISLENKQEANKLFSFVSHLSFNPYDNTIPLDKGPYTTINKNGDFDIKYKNIIVPYSQSIGYGLEFLKEKFNSFTTPSALDFTGSKTIAIEAWIKAKSVQNSYIINQGYLEYSRYQDFTLGIKKSKLLVRISTNAIYSYNILSNTTLNVNTLYHVAAIWKADSQILYIYINGILDKTVIIPGDFLDFYAKNSFTEIKTNIGNCAVNVNKYFSGIISEVRLSFDNNYNRDYILLYYLNATNNNFYTINESETSPELLSDIAWRNEYNDYEKRIKVFIKKDEIIGQETHYRFPFLLNLYTPYLNEASPHGNDLIITDKKGNRLPFERMLFRQNINQKRYAAAYGVEYFGLAKPIYDVNAEGTYRIGYLGNPGNYIKFNDFRIHNQGVHDLVIRYSNGSINSINTEIIVNGITYYVNIPSTGSWSIYNTINVPINWQSEWNTIEIGKNSSSPDIDYIVALDQSTAQLKGFVLLPKINNVEDIELHIYYSNRYAPIRINPAYKNVTKYRVEAENITDKTNYTIENSPEYSNGIGLRLANNNLKGSIRYIHNNISGYYDITLAVMSENDSSAEYKLKINGSVIKTFNTKVLAITKAFVRTYFAKRNVWLNNGDVIEIETTAGSNGNFARLDYIDFNPTLIDPNPYFNSNEVWEDYEAVWHLDGIPGEGALFYDYSGKERHIFSFGMTSGVNKINTSIGAGINFYDNDDKLYGQFDDLQFDSWDFTISTWTQRLGSLDTNRVLITSEDLNWRFERVDRMRILFGGNNFQYFSQIINNTDFFAYHAVTFNSFTEERTGYINTNLIGSNIYTNNLTGNNNSIGIGYKDEWKLYEDSPETFRGVIAEVRIKKDILSLPWQANEYKNIIYPQQYIDYNKLQREENKKNITIYDNGGSAFLALIANKALYEIPRNMNGNAVFSNINSNALIDMNYISNGGIIVTNQDTSAKIEITRQTTLAINIDKNTVIDKTIEFIRFYTGSILSGSSAIIYTLLITNGFGSLYYGKINTNFEIDNNFTLNIAFSNDVGGKTLSGGAAIDNVTIYKNIDSDGIIFSKNFTIDTNCIYNNITKIEKIIVYNNKSIDLSNYTVYNNETGYVITNIIENKEVENSVEYDFILEKNYNVSIFGKVENNKIFYILDVIQYININGIKTSSNIFIDYITKFISGSIPVGKIEAGIEHDSINKLNIKPIIIPEKILTASEREESAIYIPIINGKISINVSSVVYIDTVNKENFAVINIFSNKNISVIANFIINEYNITSKIYGNFIIKTNYNFVPLANNISINIENIFTIHYNYIFNYLIKINGTCINNNHKSIYTPVNLNGNVNIYQGSEALTFSSLLIPIGLNVVGSLNTIFDLPPMFNSNPGDIYFVKTNTVSNWWKRIESGDYIPILNPYLNTGVDGVVNSINELPNNAENGELYQVGESVNGVYYIYTEENGWVPASGYPPQVHTTIISILSIKIKSSTLYNFNEYINEENNTNGKIKVSTSESIQNVNYISTKSVEYGSVHIIGYYDNLKLERNNVSIINIKTSGNIGEVIVERNNENILKINIAGKAIVEAIHEQETNICTANIHGEVKIEIELLPYIFGFDNIVNINGSVYKPDLIDRKIDEPLYVHISGSCTADFINYNYIQKETEKIKVYVNSTLNNDYNYITDYAQSYVNVLSIQKFIIYKESLVTLKLSGESNVEFAEYIISSLFTINVNCNKEIFVSYSIESVLNIEIKKINSLVTFYDGQILNVSYFSFGKINVFEFYPLRSSIYIINDIQSLIKTNGILYPIITFDDIALDNYNKIEINGGIHYNNSKNDYLISTKVNLNISGTASVYCNYDNIYSLYTININGYANISPDYLHYAKAQIILFTGYVDNRTNIYISSIENPIIKTSIYSVRKFFIKEATVGVKAVKLFNDKIICNTILKTKIEDGQVLSVGINFNNIVIYKTYLSKKPITIASGFRVYIKFNSNISGKISALGSSINKAYYKIYSSGIIKTTDAITKKYNYVLYRDNPIIIYASGGLDSKSSYLSFSSNVIIEKLKLSGNAYTNQYRIFYYTGIKVSGNIKINSNINTVIIFKNFIANLDTLNKITIKGNVIDPAEFYMIITGRLNAYGTAKVRATYIYVLQVETVKLGININGIYSQYVKFKYTISPVQIKLSGYIKANAILHNFYWNKQAILLNATGSLIGYRIYNYLYDNIGGTVLVKGTSLTLEKNNFYYETGQKSIEVNIHFDYKQVYDKFEITGSISVFYSESFSTNISCIYNSLNSILGNFTGNATINENIYINDNLGGLAEIIGNANSKYSKIFYIEGTSAYGGSIFIYDYKTTKKLSLNAKVLKNAIYAFNIINTQFKIIYNTSKSIKANKIILSGTVRIDKISYNFSKAGIIKSTIRSISKLSINEVFNTSKKIETLGNASVKLAFTYNAIGAILLNSILIERNITVLPKLEGWIIAKGGVNNIYVNYKEIAIETSSILFNVKFIYRNSIIDLLNFNEITKRREFEAGLPDSEITNPEDTWSILQNFNDLIEDEETLKK